MHGSETKTKLKSNVTIKQNNLKDDFGKILCSLAIHIFAGLRDGSALDVSAPDFSARLFQPQDFSAPRLFSPKTFQPLDFSAPRCFSPKTFQPQIFSAPDLSAPRLFSPKTFQLLDFSAPGLFSPRCFSPCYFS